jgi:hypothetical protein
MARVRKYRHATNNSLRSEPYCDSTIIFHSFWQVQNSEAIKSSKDLHLPTEGVHEGKNRNIMLAKQQFQSSSTYDMMLLQRSNQYSIGSVAYIMLLNLVNFWNLNSILWIGRITTLQKGKEITEEAVWCLELKNCNITVCSSDYWPQLAWDKRLWCCCCYVQATIDDGWVVIWQRTLGFVLADEWNLQIKPTLAYVSVMYTE